MSNAERAVGNIKQDKAAPQQWLAMLQKNGGLKAGEDKWLGLSDWLNEKKGTVTKQEIADFIAKNRIQIEEVAYEESPSISMDDVLNSDEFLGLMGSFIEYDDDDQPYVNREKFYNEKHNDDFRYGFSIDYWGEGIDIDDPVAAARYLGLLKANPINDIRLIYTTEDLKNKREIALTVPTIEPYNESDDTHFGDAGKGRAIAWARFGETADADGKRVLVIDEIQSKRHQDGREKGYQSPEVKRRIDEIRRILKTEEVVYTAEELAAIDFWQPKGRFNPGAPTWVEKLKAEIPNLSEEGKIRAQQLLDKEKQWRSWVNEESRLRTELDNLLRENSTRVADAPFDKNWHELAMKRMLRLAAEEGYDKVAWTTGMQQAERYDIGKQVDEIQVGLRSNGAHDVVGIKDGDEVFSESVENGEAGLAELLGKDMARKAYSALHEGNVQYLKGDRASFEGEDLTIGGEGMKGFYDKILPSFMNKYGKQWGVKVGEVELPELYPGARKMHSIDVTPEMKESVMAGQPMFSKSNVTAQMDKDYLDAVERGDMETAQRFNPENEDIRYSRGDIGSQLHETLDPAAWGDMNREVKVVGEGMIPFEFHKGEKVKDIKTPLYEAAVANVKKQKNYRDINGFPCLDVDGETIAVTPRGIKHGLDRRYELNGYASALIGDLLNNSVKVPSANLENHYRVARMDIGRPCNVLITTRKTGSISQIQEIETIYSVNAKAERAEPRVTAQSTPRPATVTVSQMRDVWQSVFLPGIEAHSVARANARQNGVMFSKSAAIAEKYPNWMDNQTPSDKDGKRGQNTQIAGTVGTYKKVGGWIAENLGKDVRILDASSGLGLGTLELRKEGFDIEDVEPYPGKGRDAPPTFGGTDAYQKAMDVGREYDYIISNAVLNVIPDDWRDGVLQDMATLLKPGGKMFINTRKAGEEKSIKNKIELESPQEVLVGTPEKITSYQRFFRPEELKRYVEERLGQGYSVEIANSGNSGTSGLAAVVVTKNGNDPQTRDNGTRFSNAKIGDSIRKALQDSMLPMKRWEDAHGISHQDSVYMAEDLRYGHDEHMTRDLWTNRVNPIYDEMARQGVSQDEVDMYLMAKHGPERNALISQRTDGEVTNGSGETDAYWRGKLNIFERQGKAQKLEAVARLVRDLNDYTLDTYVDAGMMTREQADAWKAAAPNYVPLRNAPENTDERTDGLSSNITKREFRHALGRSTLADSPLVFSIMQAGQAITRANKNAVRQKLADLVRMHGLAGTVRDAVPTVTALVDGKNRDIPDMGYGENRNGHLNVVQFKEDGNLKYIELDGDEGKEIAGAVTKREIVGWPKFLDFIPKATNFLARTRTSWAPTFLLRNGLIDQRQVVMNLVSDGFAKAVGEFEKSIYTGGALRSVFKYYKDGKFDGAYGDLMKRYVEAGGLIKGASSQGYHDIQRETANRISELTGNQSLARKIFGKAGNAIELLNSTVETGTRFAVFSALVKQGVDDSLAASYSRDVTVNFNRKGNLTPITNILSMFSNANTQDIERTLRSYSGKEAGRMGALRGAGKKVAVGLVAIGMLETIVNRMLDDDDDEKEGREQYRNMSEFTKQSQFHFRVGKDKYAHFGVRGLPALLKYIGNNIGEMITGDKTLGEASGSIMRMAAETAMGGLPSSTIIPGHLGESALLAATPTIFQPVAQIAVDRRFTGDRLNRRTFDENKPKAYNGMSFTPRPYEAIAKGLNAATGGDKYSAGAVNASPEEVQLLMESLFGGLGADLGRTIGMAQDLSKGDVSVVYDFFCKLVYGVESTEEQDIP